MESGVKRRKALDLDKQPFGSWHSGELANLKDIQHVIYLDNKGNTGNGSILHGRSKKRVLARIIETY